jgi:4-amino-4-deoxy-L-arabinose transferase-like glycosyltransferase
MPVPGDRLARESRDTGRDDLSAIPHAPPRTHGDFAAPEPELLGLKASHAVIAMIAIGLALRLALCGFSGLTFNESYIVALSRHPDWGYVDHPPLAMWLVAAARWITGSEAVAVVRAPFMLLFAATAWLLYLITRDLLDTRAAAYAVLALSLAPVFSIFIGMYALTDGPMLFCVVLTGYLVQRALFAAQARATWLYWIGAGVATGAGMLSKYSAAFAPAGVALFLVSHSQYRRWLWHPGPYLAAVAAAVVFSPVLFWNAQHDWISLTFQGHRAVPEGGIKLGRLLSYLVISGTYMLPWIGGTLAIVLVAALMRGPLDPGRWFLACLAVLPVVFFALVRLLGNTEDKGYHWAAPGFVFLLPLLGDAVSRWRISYPALTRAAFHASWITVALALCVFVTNSVSGWVRVLHPRFAQRDPLMTDHLNWDELEKILQARGLLAQTSFVAATHWRECAKIDYAIGRKLPLLCLTQEPLSFSFFENQTALRGRDGVLVVTSPYPAEEVRATLGQYFDAVEPLEPARLGQFGVPTQWIGLFALRNFRANYPWPYGHGAAKP